MISEVLVHGCLALWMENKVGGKTTRKTRRDQHPDTFLKDVPVTTFH